jgi:predicted CXXCH cytochrome family protein
MPKRLFALASFAALGALFAAPNYGAGPPPAQDALAAFKDNSCVACHSNDLKAAALSNRYLEWHMSIHMEKGVSCDRCHGGNPKTDNKGKSHEGMLPPSDPQSTAHPANLPATCNACHQPEVAAFIGSKHFAAVKAAGGGPSCSACHEHMSSSVIATPGEGAALCARCHAPGEATAASKHLDVPARAEEVMAALERAAGVVVWSNGLVEGAKGRGLAVSAEEKELQEVAALVKQAKADWHAFTLTGVREKADQAFARGTKVKDALRKKLGFN